LFFKLSTFTPELLCRANIMPCFKSRPTPKLETSSGECPAPNQLSDWGRITPSGNLWTTAKTSPPDSIFKYLIAEVIDCRNVQH
jgi:hypothetical protein